MSIYYIIAGLSLFFIVIGFIITEKNAKYLLSGYNTMSKEEQEKIDIKKELSYFRKFHLFLGVSLFVFGVIINYFLGENISGIFITVYPILAYVYLAFKDFKCNKKGIIGLIIPIGVLIFLAVIFINGFRDNKITINQNTIEISGDYGQTIPKDEIKNISITHKLPAISYRSNGFSLGGYSKGYYKTKDGETIKLFINNNDEGNYLLFELKNGEKIYYCTNLQTAENLLSQIKN